MGTRKVLGVFAAALVIAGCGGSGSSTTSTPAIPGGADPADVAVIKGWVDALRRGDIDGAAGYFAIPSVAQNGPVILHIRSEDAARRFNESLPCGAVLIRAQSVGSFTTATFRLTERPGPGECGAGTGETAQTSFIIRDGRIVEWRRVGLGGGGQAAPSQST